MEAAMDDLAAKLGMNPLEFRLMNLKETDNFRDADLRDQVARGARLIGWEETGSPEGRTARGRSSTGWGWPCTSGAGAGRRTSRSPA